MNGKTGNRMFFTINNWPRLKTACKNQEELESVLRKKILLLLYLLELSVLAETVRSTNNNRDTSLSIRVFVNKHCCPLKCFIRLNFFFSCLDCLSRSLRSYRISSCYFQSYMNRVSEYLKCCVYQMNMELRSKMQTKHNILRPLPSSSSTWQLALQVWTQLGKIIFRSG